MSEINRDKLLSALECQLLVTPGCNNPYDCEYYKNCLVGCDHIKIARDAIKLIKDRAADYQKWADEIGTHTCATCGRKSDNFDTDHTDCPIEHFYAVPKDGYCHLWEERRKNNGQTSG
jgi:hypothetical protein